MVFVEDGDNGEDEGRGCGGGASRSGAEGAAARLWVVGGSEAGCGRAGRRGAGEKPPRLIGECGVPRIKHGQSERHWGGRDAAGGAAGGERPKGLDCGFDFGKVRGLV